jgi:hypothetical protein
MFGVMLGMLTPAHSDIATGIVRIANDAPLAGVPFIPAPLLTIGLILIVVGLLRAATVPKLLVVVSGEGGLLTVALLAPMCLSIAALGAILASRTGAFRKNGSREDRQRVSWVGAPTLRRVRWRIALSTHSRDTRPATKPNLHRT